MAFGKKPKVRVTVYTTTDQPGEGGGEAFFFDAADTTQDRELAKLSNGYAVLEFTVAGARRLFPARNVVRVDVDAMEDGNGAVELWENQGREDHEPVRLYLRDPDEQLAWLIWRSDGPPVSEGDLETFAGHAYGLLEGDWTLDDGVDPEPWSLQVEGHGLVHVATYSSSHRGGIRLQWRGPATPVASEAAYDYIDRRIVKKAIAEYDPTWS